jgi:hypothetical protein
MNMMANTQESEAFQGWAIVELMGHVKLAGKLSEQKLAGMSFLKLDIPAKPGTAVEGEFSATQFINPSSVYRIHPTTEDVARAVADSIAPDPVSRWEVKALMPSPALDQSRAAAAAPLPSFRYNEKTDDYEDADDDDDDRSIF